MSFCHSDCVTLPDVRYIYLITCSALQNFIENSVGAKVDAVGFCLDYSTKQAKGFCLTFSTRWLFCTVASVASFVMDLGPSGEHFLFASVDRVWGLTFPCSSKLFFALSCQWGHARSVFSHSLRSQFWLLYGTQGSKNRCQVMPNGLDEGEEQE